MVGYTLLGFGGGVVVGLLLAILLRKLIFRTLLDIPQPQIGTVECRDNNQTLRIPFSFQANPPQGVELLAMHVRIYDSETQAVPALPVLASGYGTTSPIDHPIPSGLGGTFDLVALWAEYRVYVNSHVAYPRCGSGSGSGGGFVKVAGYSRPLPATLFAHISAADGQSGGPEKVARLSHQGGGTWSGPLAAWGMSITVSVNCSPDGTWTLNLLGCPVSTSFVSRIDDPALHVSFTATGANLPPDCYLGRSKIDVVETA